MKFLLSLTYRDGIKISWRAAQKLTTLTRHSIVHQLPGSVWFIFLFRLATGEVQVDVFSLKDKELQKTKITKERGMARKLKAHLLMV